MSRVVIAAADLEAMSRHGEASYPEECCGVLIGRAGREETVVERVIPVRNERLDSRHNRFLIHPETVLAAHQEARALGRDVVGYYHSHPDHPARPSDFDREHAWPGLSYVIVAVAGGQAAEARSWRLADDRRRFDEEAIEAAGGFAGPSMEIQKEAVQ